MQIYEGRLFPFPLPGPAAIPRLKLLFKRMSLHRKEVRKSCKERSLLALEEEGEDALEKRSEESTPIRSIPKKIPYTSPVKLISKIGMATSSSGSSRNNCWIVGGDGSSSVLSLSFPSPSYTGGVSYWWEWSGIYLMKGCEVIISQEFRGIKIPRNKRRKARIKSRYHKSRNDTFLFRPIKRYLIWSNTVLCKSRGRNPSQHQNSPRKSTISDRSEVWKRWKPRNPSVASNTQIDEYRREWALRREFWSAVKKARSNKQVMEASEKKSKKMWIYKRWSSDLYRVFPIGPLIIYVWRREREGWVYRDESSFGKKGFM